MKTQWLSGGQGDRGRRRRREEEQENFSRGKIDNNTIHMAKYAVMHQLNVKLTSKSNGKGRPPI